MVEGEKKKALSIVLRFVIIFTKNVFCGKFNFLTIKK